MVFLRQATTRRPSSDGVLTWPEGNGWLTQRLAAPLRAGGQLRTGCSVLRISEGRHGVEVDAYNHTTESVERWQAPRAIVALPVFVAARVVQQRARPFCARRRSACTGRPGWWPTSTSTRLC